jgi:hypothetical protein
LRSALRFEAVILIRHPQAEWGNSHLAPLRGAGSPNPRYCTHTPSLADVSHLPPLTPPLPSPTFLHQPFMPPFSSMRWNSLGALISRLEIHSLPLQATCCGHFSWGRRRETAGPKPGHHSSHSHINFFSFGIWQTRHGTPRNIPLLFRVASLLPLARAWAAAGGGSCHFPFFSVLPPVRSPFSPVRAA